MSPTAQILPLLMLRICGMPIDSVDRLRDHDLWVSGTRTAKDLEVLNDAVTPALDLLHNVIPSLPTQERRLALSLKRRIYARKSIDLREVLSHEPFCREPFCSSLRSYAKVLEDYRHSLERFRDYHNKALESNLADVFEIATDKSFLKAILFASSDLYAAIERLGQSDISPSSGHMQTAIAITRYLLRSVGRPTPSGLWAGVLPCEFTTEIDDVELCRENETKYAIAVDSRDAIEAVKRLALTESYRLECPLFLNPTLKIDDDGNVTWVQTLGKGFRVNKKHYPSSSIALFKLFQLNSGISCSSYLDMMRANFPEDSELHCRLKAFLLDCFDRDIFRLDLFPSVDQKSTWDYLDCLADRLIEPEKSRWTESIGKLRQLCKELEELMQNDCLKTISASLETIRSEYAKLITADQPGRQMKVRVDWRPPFRVKLGTGLLHRMMDGIHATLVLLQDVGSDELFRETKIEYLRSILEGVSNLSLLANGVANQVSRDISPSVVAKIEPDYSFPLFTTRELLLRIPHSDALNRRACEVDRNFLRMLQKNILVDGSCRVSLAGRKQSFLPRAGGSMLFRRGKSGKLSYISGRPHPFVYTSRFHELLRESVQLDEAQQMLTNGAGNGFSRTEFRPALLTSQNAGIHKSLNGRVIDITTSTFDRYDIRFTDGYLALFDRSSSELGLVTYNSLALVDFCDPMQFVLFQIAMSSGWEIMELPSEVSMQSLSNVSVIPEVQTENVVVRPRKWLVPWNELMCTFKCTHFDRFRRWCDFCATHQIPERVYVQIGESALPLLLLRDSPLAIAAMFSLIKSSSDAIVLTEFDANSLWVAEASGQTLRGSYVAEIAVSWIPTQTTESFGHHAS